MHKIHSLFKVRRVHLKVLLRFFTVLFNSKEHPASSTDACERRTIYNELTAQAKVLNRHAWATEVLLLFSVKCTYPWPTKWNSIHDDISVFVLKFSKILSYRWRRSFSHKIKYKNIITVSLCYSNQYIALGTGFYCNACMIPLLLWRLQRTANSLHDSKLRGKCNA